MFMVNNKYVLSRSCWRGKKPAASIALRGNTNCMFYVSEVEWFSFGRQFESELAQSLEAHRTQSLHRIQGLSDAGSSLENQSPAAKETTSTISPTILYISLLLCQYYTNLHSNATNIASFIRPIYQLTMHLECSPPIAPITHIPLQSYQGMAIG